MMRYRREIDGLRAVAVLPVILFHAGFPMFSGGFVGVDVFFVISGFLITSILTSQLEAGSFSLVEFYERRARRILPALFLVMLVCLTIAWYVLLPADMKRFSQSLVAVSVFSSNVLWWQTSGYFATSAELNPLLHTWSLAVEEQFYLLFPLLLTVAWRFGRRSILLALGFVAIGSLTAAQLLEKTQPDAAFYLLPTRAWELTVGALLAVYELRLDTTVRDGLRAEIGGAAGIVLLLTAIFAFDSQTPFPGLFALVPVLGAALIIFYASPHTTVGRLLGNQLLVSIGLISYSAYLWHQPVLAFARHRSIQELSAVSSLSLVLLSIGLAFLTWKFVERPWRNRSRFRRSTVFSLALGATCLFASVGFAGHLSRGFPSRLTESRRQYLEYFDNDRPEMHFFETASILSEFRNQCDFFNLQVFRSGGWTRLPKDTIASECYERDRSIAHSVLVWGDSHAQQLYPGLRRELPNDWQILQVTSSGCNPEVVEHPLSNDYCERSNWFALETIQKARPDVVVIGQNLGHSPQRMMSLALRLKQDGVKTVLLTGPSPHWVLDLPKIIVQNLWASTPTRSFMGVDRTVLASDSILSAALPKTGSVRYVSLIRHFCDRRGCLTYLGTDRRRGITSWDYGHLTPIASTSFAKSVLVSEILHGSL